MDLQQFVDKLVARLESELVLVTNLHDSMPNLGFRASGGSISLAILTFIYDMMEDLDATARAQLAGQAIENEMVFHEAQVHNFLDRYFWSIDMPRRRDLAYAGKLAADSMEIFIPRILARLAICSSRSLRAMSREHPLGLDNVFGLETEQVMELFDQLDAAEDAALDP